MRLPTNIQEIILNMLTIKKSNDKISNEFNICIKIDPQINPNNVEDEVRNWVYSKLNTEDHQGFVFIYEVYSNQADEPEDKYIEINFLLHYEVEHDDEEMDDDGLIIINEPPLIPQISPNSLLKKLLEEPEYVIGIGVSGTSEKWMSSRWWNMIGGHDNYMTYPSFPSFSFGGSIREQSFQFGWKNYPPEEKLNHFI